jgi:osmotically-inducible protein OsmY
MRRHYHSLLSVLAASAAGALASAQEPHPALPTADAAPAAREHVDTSDAQLALEVQERLYQELGVGNLSALVRYGVVTIDGMVRSEADLARAEQLALEIHGVHSVINQLSVTPPLSVASADEAAAVRQRESVSIETEIAARLSTDAALGSRPISIVVDETTKAVSLTGTVTTQEEKERAGLLAAEAFPAGQVRNLLEVRQRL